MSSTANAIRNKALNPPSTMQRRLFISPFQKSHRHLTDSHRHSLSPILPSPLPLYSSPIVMPLAADVNATLLRSLKIVQSLGEAVPHGGILKAIAGIGITILEIAERVRLNKEECADIARRAAEHISVLKRLDEDEELSEDLRERLERYHRVLEDVSTIVERIGSSPKMKGIFRATSVQEETKDCLDKLNEAYQMYIFEFTIATDNKLTALVNGVRSMSLRMEPQICRNRSWDEPDEVRRIPVDDISFLDEISCIKKRGYTMRVGHAEILNSLGQPKAVIVRKFVATDTSDDGARYAFETEVGLRRELLDGAFARMIAISVASQRTKIVVVEAAEATIIAYDYLQTLSGLDYFLEHTRIMCEFVSGYRFLREHRGSWRCRYREVLLSAKDKRLCLGGLGRMDGRWQDSGWRMNEAFLRLKDGDDLSAGGNVSFEQTADLFERTRESLSRWNEEKTEESARDLFYWLWLWSRSSESERAMENSPTVGEIGWIDGNGWNPIPLVHQFPLANPSEYSFSASRWRDGEWETIVGTQIGGYTRWSIDVSPGEEIYLRTLVSSYHTKDIADFFRRSALSLAKDSGFDVRSLRLVSRTGLDVYASLVVFNKQTSPVYYFAYPRNPDGSVPEPPGFWSRCPYPLCSDCRLHADAAQVGFHVEPFVQYKRINNHAVALLQNLESHGFLPVPDITYASDPSFATISEVSDQQAPDSIITPRGKKRRAKDLFSIFSKRRKVSNS
ncbi:hypothetical protein SISNIDRAFT_491396 [Sistotremastrum niveocremeum HHB9708]|uniref:Mixed lineage kinase domain-containing protein n=1 Tax=Sistotremastrum niveocremeum HHB9708 TaxID=1314777 RepID=A0A164MUG8_9AGAM|nr:hypothetical protein SISNIDRAFT_491396 [Sistotremastrum niveocremeum HHB9708]